MKTATGILIGLATASVGYLLWALHKQTKELMYAAVKKFYLLIIAALLIFAYGEVRGWGSIFNFLKEVGYVMAGIVVLIVTIILGINLYPRLTDYLEERSAKMRAEKVFARNAGESDTD